MIPSVAVDSQSLSVHEPVPHPHFIFAFSPIQCAPLPSHRVRHSSPAPEEESRAPWRRT
ncbi:hypothetical protein C2E23DRAFT_847706 [Lenzites betulinus]|nr:hypothetical protein C2E23DRAFT_847706 [Lenzites betulinus]